MDIIYTNKNMPVVVVDGVAYNFNSPDQGEILAQLSMHPEKISEIKNKIIEYFETIKWENFSMESESYANMKSFISYASDAHLFNHVINILEDAHNTSVMLSTPQPYESWFWDMSKEQWSPPFTYPENAPDGVYMWDEPETKWVPVEQRPHPSWEWDAVNLKYQPPVAYPVDAEDDKFVWNEQTRTWVLNDQMG